jgi:hypothetical protein
MWYVLEEDTGGVVVYGACVSMIRDSRNIFSLSLSLS